MQLFRIFNIIIKKITYITIFIVAFYEVCAEFRGIFNPFKTHSKPPSGKFCDIARQYKLFIWYYIRSYITLHYITFIYPFSKIIQKFKIYIYTYTLTQRHTQHTVHAYVYVYSLCICACTYIHNHIYFYCNTSREQDLQKTKSLIIKL